ncbi:MAG: AAA family ATPase [Bacteroidales bacterium]
MNLNQIKRSLTTLFDANITPLFIGHAGVGKTSIVQQYAEENGFDLKVIRLGTMSDAGDLLGLADFKRGIDGIAIETLYVAPKFIPLNGRTEKKTILFFDEINRCHKDLIQAIFQVVEGGGQLGPHNLDAGTKVIAACNPPSDDYMVLDITDAAFNDRFCHIAFEPTVEDFLSYAKEKFNNSIYEFYRDQPQFIEMTRSHIDLSYVKPSRRSGEKVSKLMNLKIPDDVRMEVFAGIIGAEAATSLERYLKEKVTNVDPKDVLYSYKKVAKKVKAMDMATLNSTFNGMKDLLGEIEPGNFKPLLPNLVQFLKDVPVEFMTNAIIQMLLVENFINDDDTIELLLNNDDLTAIILEQRKLGVVDKVIADYTAAQEAEKKEE